MTVFSKLWNANVPSESESKTSTRTVAVATAQFRDDDGLMMAPNSSGTSNKYWCGATSKSKLMKGALIIAGVSGASWVVGKAVGSAKANNTAALLLKEASAKATKASKTPGSPKAKAGKGGGKVSSTMSLEKSVNLCVRLRLNSSDQYFLCGSTYH